MSAIKPEPISLSDDQLVAVMRACAPLQAIDRDPFLRALAHRLRGETIGDGLVFRAIRELLSGGYFKPPHVHKPMSMTPARLARQRAAAPILDD
jgi:hypothetical protein